MMQPWNPPSLAPESSNVTVVENLTNHDPSHIIEHHTALGLREKGGHAGNGSVIAYAQSRKAKYNNEDDVETKY